MTLAVVALALAGIAVILAGFGLRTALRLRSGRTFGTDGEPVPPDLEALRDEVVRLRADAVETLRHLTVVRYDAFGDMGGHLSWSLALLDDGGNGVVLTSIHGRSDARTYAKNVTGWSCDAQLSPEEAEAIGYARDNR
ncbi:MAG: DUF4446 family protein [Nocardioidaceae bacterium]|nr:DUF4446 family protein [Nocardioidaceae bacterium]